MAKAWIQDRWLRSKAVVDGVETVPTAAMRRQVAANPDAADVPAALRTVDYGRGMRWQVCWRADGRQHRESLPTREAAEVRAAELNDDIRSGRYIDPKGGRRTLDEVFPLWLADHTGVRPSTIDSYVRRYKSMVGPRFGSTRIGDIDKAAVKQWVRDLDTGAIVTGNDRPYAKGEIRTAVSRILGSMMRFAVENRWITTDPTHGVHTPRVPAQRVDAFTMDEVLALADAAGKLRTPTGRPCGRPMDRLLVLFLASTGVRPGEMAALDVRDVDFEHGRINVTKTMTKAEAGHYRYVQGEPKTPKARRRLPLPRHLRDGLRCLCEGRDGGGPLFTSPRGERIIYQQWRHRVFRPAMAAAGIDPGDRTLTMYSLRHTYASIAIANGADVKTLQELMGHEDATVTLNTYAAAFADRRVEVTDAVSDAFAMALG
ncbi:tyrosine-type recombinase/integrase [Bifidobacterium moukalabense]|uniref:tyrosine-type recombinase/integrase n=1 Tax=Bifidobacterium moukalabense TaxID=1333651 RepID=UPI0010F59E5C|nr:site-specific integrase [Bifidobacterium moukalabense]